MHSSGPCPVCGRTVASSAESCPNCGNRDFVVKTGRRLRYVCKCEGLGTTDSGDICPNCKGEGLIYVQQKADSRNDGWAYKQAKDNERTQKLDEEKLRKAVDNRAKRIEQRRQNEAQLSKWQRDKNLQSAWETAAGAFIMSLGLVIYVTVGFVGCLVRIQSDITAGHQAYTKEAVYSAGTVISIGVLIAVISLSAGIYGYWKSK